MWSDTVPPHFSRIIWWSDKIFFPRLALIRISGILTRYLVLVPWYLWRMPGLYREELHLNMGKDLNISPDALYVISVRLPVNLFDLKYHLIHPSVPQVRSLPLHADSSILVVENPSSARAWCMSEMADPHHRSCTCPPTVQSFGLDGRRMRLLCLSIVYEGLATGVGRNNKSLSCV